MTNAPFSTASIVLAKCLTQKIFRTLVAVLEKATELNPEDRDQVHTPQNNTQEMPSVGEGKEAGDSGAKNLHLSRSDILPNEDDWLVSANLNYRLLLTGVKAMSGEVAGNGALHFPQQGYSLVGGEEMSNPGFVEYTPSGRIDEMKE